MCKETDGKEKMEKKLNITLEVLSERTNDRKKKQREETKRCCLKFPFFSPLTLIL